MIARATWAAGLGIFAASLFLSTSAFSQTETLVTLNGKEYRQVEEDETQQLGMFWVKTGRRVIYLKTKIGAYAFMAAQNDRDVVGYFNTAVLFLNADVSADGLVTRSSDPTHFLKVDGADGSYFNNVYAYGFFYRNQGLVCTMAPDGTVQSVVGSMEFTRNFLISVARLTPSSGVRVVYAGTLVRPDAKGKPEKMIVNLNLTEDRQGTFLSAGGKTGPVDRAMLAKCW